VPLTGSVSYIGKNAGSCASAKKSMRTAVRFPMAADLRDLHLGLARPLHGDLKGRATGPFRRTSGGEGLSPAQDRGHKTSLYKT